MRVGLNPAVEYLELVGYFFVVEVVDELDGEAEDVLFVLGSENLE